jgi:hypothetical protein
MPMLRLQQFGGKVPVKGDRALPENFAVESINTWFYADELVGIRPRTELTPLGINNITRKVFRIPKGSTNLPEYPGVAPPPSYLYDSYWIQFTDMDTDIVRGPLVNDGFKRWYFCSPTTGLMYNTYARMLNGDPALKVGVPNPPLGTTWITGSGGSGATVTVAYTYTWETEYGEESGPTSPCSAAYYVNGVWTINGLQTPADDLNRAKITKLNIYRTITSASGVATYFKVVTLTRALPATVPFPTTYADDRTGMTDAILAGNLQLDTTNWSQPPAGLQGIIAMPNGFLIGWVGSDVYCSEAYQPHAWPVEYVTATEYPVVGLGVLGTTCVICTQGFPATLSGVKPVSLSYTKATTNEPCLARGSIVSTPNGVYYASQNGLISVSPAGINNITKDIITREDWIRHYDPPNLRSVRYQNGYLALRCKPAPNDNARSAFFLDPTSLQVALTEYSEFETVRNIHNDVWSGEVFVIDEKPPDRMVYRWDPPTNPNGSPNDDLMPVLWLSKEFTAPLQNNFAAYALFWDDLRYSSNNHSTNIIPANQKARVRVFADRRLVYDQEVPPTRNGLGVRLPSGFKALVWQFEIRARAPVYQFHVASTMKELRGA